MASAFNRKVRERALSLNQRDRLWRQYRSHLRHQYRVNTPDEEVYRRAERLLFRHTLRASDAAQIAGALQAERLLVSVSSDFHFCTADRAQATAAEREGLEVLFIV